MHQKWVFKHFIYKSDRYFLYLAAFWFVGLLAGILLSGQCTAEYIEVFRSSLSVSPTPVLLILVVSVPIASIIVALRLPSFNLRCFLVLAFAVCYGFCGALVYAAQGNGAWLLRPLLQFSATGSSLIIWWLLLRSRNKRISGIEVFPAIAFALFVYLIDLLVVLPFLNDLL